MEKIAIGTATAVRLRTLIVSGTLEEYSQIEVLDCDGDLLDRGLWFSKEVFRWADQWGVVTEKKAKNIVCFRLLHQ